MDDFSRDVSMAVAHFWKTRSAQSDSQGRDGARDMGGRSAVTGGRQMDGFVSLIRHFLVTAKCPEDAIYFGKKVELPGWFRAEKQWDVVVIIEDQLIAAIELKSQIGPSFGNNFNNRTEEAMGSATDIWAAYREGAFKPSARPWLGYLMLLQDCARSSTPVRVAEPHFEVFPEFRTASYQQRYRLFIQKLVRDRLYDAGSLIVSADADHFFEPDPELSFGVFIRSLVGRVACISGGGSTSAS